MIGIERRVGEHGILIVGGLRRALATVMVTVAARAEVVRVLSA